MSSETAGLLNSQGMNLDVHDVSVLAPRLSGHLLIFRPQVLSSVPPSWSLSSISSFLTRSFRRSQHVAHGESVVKSIAWGQNLRVSDRAFTVIREQGGMVEEPTEASPTDTEPEEQSAGEPSSYSENEKIVIPGPEPLVGSLTTVDLARKEGFDDQHLGSDSDGELV